MKEFNQQLLKELFKPKSDSVKTDNGQVTIIGGSSLFHGAPLLALKTASRIVDMVFFSSPEPSFAEISTELKSKLSSFIWVPFEEIADYIKKSEAVLIGPGLMRFKNEKQREECQRRRICCLEGLKTKKFTESLLKQFPQKQWVIDGGSLQVMDAKFIPRNAILTPNSKEFKMLFGPNFAEVSRSMAKKYNCIIILKQPQTLVCSPESCLLVKGGNAGLTKGGTGDVLAGLTVALAAKNKPFLAACTASWILKKTADELYKKVGFAYNADDLAEKIPEVLGEYFR